MDVLLSKHAAEELIEKIGHRDRFYEERS